MDPIHSVSQVMDALRRKMSENLETLRLAGRLPLYQRTTARPTRARSPADLRRVAARRVGSVSENDPAFQQKTALLFVESVLLDQFGENLVNDPAFRQLVDQVCTTMTQDEETASDLRALIAELRKR